MASTIVITGFPGFLTKDLLPLLWQRYDESYTITCLVDPVMMKQAERWVEQQSEEDSSLADRIRLYESDVREADLGLSTGRLNYLKGATTEIYHFATVNDLNIEMEQAKEVNLDGTRNVLEFAERCSKLERFHHLSSAFVAGKHDGLFREEDLVIGQSFNNHYEISKFYAERWVRHAMSKGLPATIYRPSSVAGKIDTGASETLDGLYYVIDWMQRMPKGVPFPDFGMMDETEVNVVPSDYVVRAITHLSSLEESKGKTYNLVDPNPPTVREAYQVLTEAMGKKLPPVRFPFKMAKKAARACKVVRFCFGFPPQLLDYFVLPTRFDDTNAQRDLEGSGIKTPDYLEYYPKLVEFMQGDE